MKKFVPVLLACSFSVSLAAQVVAVKAGTLIDPEAGKAIQNQIILIRN